jgi:hypothetical protein
MNQALFLERARRGEVRVTKFEHYTPLSDELDYKINFVVSLIRINFVVITSSDFLAQQPQQH